MSRLSDVVNHVVQSELDPKSGRTDIPRAVSAAKPMLDEEDRDALVSEALWKRIKDAACKAKKAAWRIPSAQIELFPEIRDAHALDTEGRQVMQTDAMSEMQFLRLIEIRRKQVSDDTAYLKVLEDAFRMACPIWRDHPNWTFGDVCKALLKAARRHRDGDGEAA